MSGGCPATAAAPAGRAAGLTLAEVLVALALAAVVGLAAARLLQASQRPRTTAGIAADHAQTLDVASGLLSGTLRRAGYRPFPLPAGMTLGASPTLVLHLAGVGRSDELAVRYIDDRLASGPRLRDVSFTVGVDARGEWQLYRRAGAGTRQPLVHGIDELRLVAWSDAAGLHRRGDLVGGGLRPWALELQLGTDADTRRVVVTLPGRPLTQVVTTP